ncbi:type III pantothenate kinase [Flavobacterium piscinae]|uniref:Type III pantothenate kinase n=1 Tax=Flavobacterium piscinae TaxID=2506424 RepID=A0A4Q1KYQ0_9FLAO|nr:type III pantothenate kinase [Flavobacterium piscinae]RXR35518.1 type III pantothenate kinase [Flavobacterium piscinae]
MVLVVDVGNTRIKCAVYELDILKATFVFTENEVENNLKNILISYPKVTDLIVSSVAKALTFDLQTISNDLNIHFVSNLDSFPFENKYTTPKTLGVDRMILAAGATLLFPGKNRLIIDAGTCVTYDFVDEYDNYWGGAISPGLRLRYASLHQFTAKLPLLSLEEPSGIVGNSTNQSIHSGVVNGLICEIDGFIERFKQQNENFTIILTGGDAVFLAKRLKNTIFANSNFLLESLNQFFQYKIKND